MKKTCKYCGKQFKTYNSKRKFCSQQCFRKWLEAVSKAPAPVFEHDIGVFKTVLPVEKAISEGLKQIEKDYKKERKEE